MTLPLNIHTRPAFDWLGKVLLLAAIYFFSGKLGLLLAVPPGYATAVWPPSGLALVGVLLLGKRHWPGILLGSFCVNIGMSFDGSSSAAILRSLAVATSIGFGASLQAVAGAWLVHLFVAWPAALVKSRKILTFMLVSGPLGCVVGASWGVATLLAARVIPISAWSVNWGTWWVGDTLGVWIFAIIGLVAFGQPREVWQNRWRSVALPLAVSFAVAVAIFRFVQKSDDARERTAFTEKAQVQVSRLVLAARTNEAILHGLAGLFDASPNVSRQEFHTYARQALRLYGGIEALAWIPRVPGNQRAEYEAAARRDGFTIYEFKELADGKLVRAGERPEYYPSFYLEKKEGKDPPTGLDLSSEPTRHAPLQQACDMGTDQASVPIDFVNNQGRGFFVTVPVYDLSSLDETLRSLNNTPGESEQLRLLRRERLRGFVTGGFLLDHIKNDALDKSAWGQMQLYVEDVTDPKSPAFVFGAGKGMGRQTAPAWSDADWSTTIKIGERAWQMRFIPLLEYRIAQHSMATWSVLAGAFLFTSLLGSVLLVITGGTTLVELTVKERTAELTALNGELKSEVAERRRAEGQLKVSEASLQASLNEKEVLLREVHHRVKNNMQVISSLLNLQSISANRPEEVDVFRECQMRIQAMAMIHDRLYRSTSIATVDFGEHLVELATLIVRSSPSAGAKVEMKTNCAHIELTLDTAIPLGLVATELVSNACKHAFQGRPSGKLNVELLAPAPGSLILRVSDDGPGLPAGYDLRKAKSLGMRLIDSLTKQIRGRISIRAEGQGAEIEVTLPSLPAISIPSSAASHPHATAA